MTIVQVKNLRKTYPLGKVLVEAVKGIDFSIDSGEFVSIFMAVGVGQIDDLEYDRVNRHADIGRAYH